jgi:hypothetical protein
MKDISLRKTTSPKDENFCFTKFQFLDSDSIQSDLREADQLLEEEIRYHFSFLLSSYSPLPFLFHLPKSARVCDTKEYMDTLTVSRNLLNDVDTFFYIMV